MHLKIRHRTEYRYETPVRYSIQELRLTPPAVAGQQIDKWKISTPIKASNSIDTFGNVCSVFVQETPYTSMMLEAEGEVHTEDAFEFIDDPKSVSHIIFCSRPISQSLQKPCWNISLTVFQRKIQLIKY
ncbi:transglutaminase N-terminal domain-containing protein [Polynucleobacter sp. KF022]|uniref:transglutaminase N-terminal domain-containing protein n=1 Tax=Polynucleobacter sp. KF022 TaxID=2982615 RepID=UPI002377A9BC|nr:transglutaminase N-terminal domain-containing protein [Polynucleobacter sp. KF022]BDT74918.1 hypothetical protein PKF022_05830 [Polynucleobacter sp. KF022]